MTSSNATAGPSSSWRTASGSSKAPLRAIFLHTHDVARNLKPSADGELANALHETLHFALDGRFEDWGLRESEEDRNCGGASSAPAGNGRAVPSGDQGEQEEDEDLPPARPGFFPTGNPDHPYISYAWDERNGVLSLPNPVVISNPTTQDPCSPENRSAFEVTAKFFFLEDEQDRANILSSATASREGRSKGRFKLEYIQDALQRLTLTTSLITIDTFVVSFPSLQLDRSEQTESGSDQAAQLDQDIQAVIDVWESISPNPQLLSLGLADFNLAHLQHLLQACTHHDSSLSNGSASAHVAQPASDSARKPSLVTINVKDNPCAFDKELNAWCEKQGIQVVAHNDQRDILPARTLPSLLQEFKDDLPRSVPEGKTMKARWILKYSTVIKERGILADKGYIVYVEWV